MNLGDIRYNETYTTYEAYLHDTSPPVLFINHCSPPDLLQTARYTAFEILRTPAYCVYNFGEAVLYALKKKNGIVVDFGLDFGSDFDPLVPGEFEKLPIVTDEHFVSAGGASQSVIVEAVQNGNRRKICAVDRTEEAVISAIAGCISLNSNNKEEQEMRQNVVLVGSNPIPPDVLKTRLKGTFEDIQVYTVPNKATIIWEGAGLFATATFQDPKYYSDTYSAYTSIQEANKCGTWMSREVYIKHQNKEALDQWFGEVLQSREERRKEGKCIIA